MEIKCVTTPIQHAEGPFWDERDQYLYFVDTFKANILRYDPNSQNTSTYKLRNARSIGIIIPIKDKTDEFIVAADRNIMKLKWNGSNQNIGRTQKLLQVDEDKPNNEFNDGKVDSKGRLWAGTLGRKDSNSVILRQGSLYKFYSDPASNTLKTVLELSDVTISNGMAWSKNNKKMFYTDSDTKKIVSYDFDEIEGTKSNEEIIFDLHQHPDLEGIPDGMTIDTDDNLWVALFGGKKIIQINPYTKKMIRVIDFPVTYVTSLAFGGPNLDILYVTTSRKKLHPVDLTKEWNAGCVYAVTNLGVRGLPANKFIMH